MLMDCIMKCIYLNGRKKNRNVSEGEQIVTSVAIILCNYFKLHADTIEYKITSVYLFMLKANCSVRKLLLISQYLSVLSPF